MRKIALLAVVAVCAACSADTTRKTWVIACNASYNAIEALAVHADRMTDGQVRKVDFAIAAVNEACRRDEPPTRTEALDALTDAAFDLAQMQKELSDGN